MKKYITVQEASSIGDCTLAYIYYLINKKVFSAYKKRGKYYVLSKEVDSYFNTYERIEKS